MTNQTYNTLLKFPKLLGTHKHQIIKLLSKNKEMNMSEVQRALNISYKETRRHLIGLFKMDIITLKKLSKERHQPTICSLKKR